MECKKCGKENPSVEVMILLGGYVTELCTDCRNKWHKFIIATEEYKHRNKLEIDLKLALQKKERDWALDIEAEIVESERHFSRIGKKWCTGVTNKK